MSPLKGTHAAETEPHVVVVGGGVIGVCTAYFLVRRGARVTLLERDQIGEAASFGNAGLISPGHPPINKPGRVRQALRSLADPLSPLYVAPRWDPSFAGWLWSFSRYCNQEHVELSMEVVARLGRETSLLFDRLVEEESLECGYRRSGYLEIFVTEEGMTVGKEEADLVARHGIETEELGGGELREREPALAQNVRGGWYHPEGTILDPYRFVRELADRAVERGAEVRTETEVREVVADRGRVLGVRMTDGEMVEAHAVVLATGAYSRHLPRELGLPLPVEPAKGYHSDRDPTVAGTPSIRNPCLLGERSVFCSPIGEFVRFAGTLEFSGENHRIRRPRLEQLTRGAAQYMDGIGEAEALSEWCGLRPCTPDGLPVVGRVPGTLGAFVATGHAMLGLTLGPITGRLVAEFIIDGAPSMDVSLLSPARFRRRA
jgi:D-amino-acid dehydrogenase